MEIGPTQAWNKAKISLYMPLKTALSTCVKISMTQTASECSDFFLLARQEGKGGGKLLPCSHNLQSDQQGSYRKSYRQICVLFLAIIFW